MNTQTKSQNGQVSDKRQARTTKTRKCGPISVYLAGDLWTHKDLIGNALLADYVRKVSKGRYVCVLPQDLEEPVNRTVDIRNNDLKQVMVCDMAIFNFDGANLDAGTVVEFIYAKLLDVPSVLLRTDFRSAGEGNQDQDPWNLMASSWPRTHVLKLHGMAEYQSAKKAGGSLSKTVHGLYVKMAEQLIASLDAVRQEAPLANPSQISMLYDWALTIPGAGYKQLFADSEAGALITGKTAKGLLAK